MSSWAGNSKIIPIFLEASETYALGKGIYQGFYLRPDLRAVISVLEKHQIDPALLEKYTSQKTTNWPLREDDQYDGWVSNPDKVSGEVPEITVHASKLDVIEAHDEFFRDDVYAYFFVTDGVIPTGKVTSIYKGLSSKQGFFFNEIDRSIFPLIGMASKKPQNHLIIDYGIIESDGDDIKEMQKLSSIIIDIAIAVYSSYDPQNAQVLINLRKEIKALTDMLLALKHDDRLATSSIGYKVSELQALLKNESYVELTKNHHGKGEFKDWEYKLLFRILRN
jgi:hypothetical protein